MLARFDLMGVGPVLVTALALTACVEQNDLGEYCFVGVTQCDPWEPGCAPDPMSHPDCLEGVCFKQGGYDCPDGVVDCAQDPSAQVKLHPYCTRRCQVSSECGASSGGVNGCGGYVCEQQAPETGYDDACLCVCLDFLRDADGVPVTREEFEAGDRSCR